MFFFIYISLPHGKEISLRHSEFDRATVGREWDEVALLHSSLPPCFSYISAFLGGFWFFKKYFGK